MKNITISADNDNNYVIKINGEKCDTERYENFKSKHKNKIESSSKIALIGSASIDVINGLISEKNIQQIFVIEPNSTFFSCAKNLNYYTESNKVTYISKRNISQYFENEKLVRFLTNKPTIMWDQNTQKTNSQFIKDFLSFKANNNLNLDRAYIFPKKTRESLSALLKNFDGKEIDLQMASNYINDRKTKSLINALYSLR